MESLTLAKEETCETNNEEMQYINLVKDIFARGHTEVGRNGTTISLFGASMRFSLTNGQIPILTTKKVAWKTCLKELLWFIKGKTNNNILKEQGVHIWDGNASREFLESRGLGEYQDGELGPIYGHQWRHFNAEWVGDVEYIGKGIDQLQEIIDQLKNPDTRTSRRLIMTAWNPCQLVQMALPPCHVMCQFNVHGGNQLSCALYQRSGDVGLGICFNIASYSFLTHLLAKHCGLEACEFVYFLGNAHIYDDHIDSMKEQILRKPFDFPKVKIKQMRENINDYDVCDFEVTNYKSYEKIKMNMRK
uniref:thymidylate synthase n=1 Tax=viral metagenome TaxID=1070528 RepID=A0A6C0F630_9ZZZZ